MAAITWSEVVDFASELSTADAEVQTLILAYVNGSLNVTEFDGEDGNKTKLIRIHLAAHLGTVASESGTGTAGPILKDKAGDLETTYANIATQATDPSRLATTNYGKMFLALVNTTTARMPIIA